MAPKGETITYFEKGKQVYPCRCGKFHTGEYAVKALGHKKPKKQRKG
jgi:hypothetical protein